MISHSSQSFFFVLSCFFVLLLSSSFKVHRPDSWWILNKMPNAYNTPNNIQKTTELNNLGVKYQKEEWTPRMQSFIECSFKLECASRLYNKMVITLKIQETKDSIGLIDRKEKNELI